LTFVNNPHPASITVDQLEIDFVPMDIIGYKTSVKNTNMRSNKEPPLPLWDEVTILHTGSTLPPN
jgi:hypothetical protein